MALRRYRSVVADSSRWEGFEYRAGDIVISTPPKSGTTWTQMLVALLVFGSPEFPRPLSQISLWLDMQLASKDDVFARLDAQTHRRFIKSHTPLSGLPYDERVTYLCVGRDPRDVAVSCRHHMANLDLEQFLKTREQAVGLEDLAELVPPQQSAPTDPITEYLETDFESDNLNVMTLSYVLHHLQSFWDRREEPNIALFHYSDLQADLPGQLRRLAAVLDIELPESKVDELAAAASFAAMRDNAEMVAPNSDARIWRSTSDFFHRGSNGQWREAFGEAMLRRYDERTAALAAPDLLAWAHSGWLAESPTSTSAEAASDR
jgi:aryl sulfotransferase